jgi:hypothetical protein
MRVDHSTPASDPEAPATCRRQRYLYSQVARNGTWLIENRDGEVSGTVESRTPNAAVKTPDAGGRSTYALEVRVGAEKLDFAVNGTVEQRLRSTAWLGLLNTMISRPLWLL